MYEAAVSGKCGCEAQQHALQMGKTRFMAQSAAVGAFGGTIFGGLTAVFPGAAVLLGVGSGFAGMGASGYDMARNGLNLCNGINFATSALSIAGGISLQGGGGSSRGFPIPVPKIELGFAHLGPVVQAQQYMTVVWAHSEVLSVGMMSSMGPMFFSDEGNGNASPNNNTPEGYIDPNQVRFSQNSASYRFKNSNMTIGDLVEGLQSGTIDPSEVSPIRIFERNDILYTLDNRRLEAFRRANMDVPYRMATQSEIVNESWKFTTKNDGISIYIRGE